MLQKNDELQLTLQKRLRALVAQLRFKKVYTLGSAAPTLEKINCSIHQHRLAIPLEGIHQMIIPKANSLEKIDPMPGDLIWMPVGTWNAPTWEPSVETVTFIFDQSLIRFHWVIHDAEQKQHRLLTYGFTWPKQHWVKDLMLILNREDLSEDVLLPLLESFVLITIDLMGEVQNEKKLSKGEQLYVSIDQWLGEHALEPVDRTSIAQQFRVSEAHISRLFQRFGTLSFSETLVKYRMDFAKQMLSTRELKISKLALICGYSEVNYFCRSFKKMEGLTPLEWQKQVGEK